MYEELVQAIVDMRAKEAVAMARRLLDAGENPLGLLESCREAVERVGDRFQKGEYFLPELMMAGNMLTQISNLAKPRMRDAAENKRRGRVLIGTVQGDIHDIGKNIVTFLLDANGFEVLDIGIDAPPSRFVASIREFKPQVLGLSGLLTVAYDTMKETVSAIEEAGLREEVRIMIGGGQMSDAIRAYAGADAYGKDAMEAVVLAKRWIGVK